MKLIFVKASASRPNMSNLVSFGSNAFVLDDIVSGNKPQGNFKRVVRSLFGSAHDQFWSSKYPHFCLLVNDKTCRNHGGNRADDYKKQFQSFLLCVGSFYFAQQFCPTKGEFFLRGIGL